MGPIYAMLAGWIAGALTNYFADVLPVARKLGKASCPKCNADLTWKHYLLFNNCTNCHTPPGIRSYVVVVGTVLASAFVWFFPPAHLNYIPGLLVIIYFGTVAVIDIEHRLILHPVSAAGAILGLALGTWAHGFPSTLLGGLAGLGIMGLLYLVGVLFSKYRARRLAKEDQEESLGFGDVILAGILGLMLGWPAIWLSLLLGILLGGLISLVIIIFLMVTKRYQSMSFFIAYGPYLILGAALVMFIVAPVRDFIVK